MNITQVSWGQDVSDSDYVWLEVPGSGSGSLSLPNDTDTSFALAVMLNTATALGSLTIPLTFFGLPELTVDSTVVTPPNEFGVTYGPAGDHPAWFSRTSSLDQASQSIMLNLISFASFPATGGTDTLAYLHFRLDSSGQNALVVVDSTTRPPGNSLALTDITATRHIPEWSPATLSVGVSSVADQGVAPDAYLLEQNAPNPFNAQTTIAFSMSRADHVKLTVFNMLGQKIAALVNGNLEASQHRVVWDGVDAYGSKVASGTYLYRLEIGDAFEETRRMTLLK